MIKPSLFRKHLIITVAITVFCMGLGQLAFHLSNRMNDHLDRDRMESYPPQFFGRLLDQLRQSSGVTGPLRVLDAISQTDSPSLPFTFLLADQGGHVFYPATDPALRVIPDASLPADVYGVKVLEQKPGAELPSTVIRLAGEPVRFLVLLPRPSQGSRALLGRIFGHGRIRGARRGGGSGIFFMSLGYMLISVFMATLLSVFLLFYGMREKARLANSVIKELQKGNLKARFPIRKLDEIGQAMLSFNRMADEIERLVERLKSTEQARLALLQELTHDLRTPVASLKSLLETLTARRDELPERVRSELMELSLKEVEYFERLVEDLLFLARVAEPRYRAASENVRFLELAHDEVEMALSRYLPIKPDLEIVEEVPDEGEGVLLPGDPHLLRRLLRNALENALSFAHKKVTVRVSVHEAGEKGGVPEGGRFAEVLIEDDGPGLTAAAIEAFGKRRTSRALEESQGGRLSVGLGSVIMRTIVELHRGGALDLKPGGGARRTCCRRDPCLALAPRSVSPFPWDELQRPLNPSLDAEAAVLLFK